MSDWKFYGDWKALANQAELLKNKEIDRITLDELKELENAKTDQEWNNICSKIKKARNGEWPSDWAEKVLFGNLKTKLNLGLKISAF